MTSNVHFNTTSRTIEDMVNALNNNHLVIPIHQRNGNVWNDTTRKNFIDTIMNGYPIPSLLIHKDGSINSLEDGLQRITTLKRFKNDEFSDNHGKKYSDWGVGQQQHFKNYPLPLVKFRNATLEQRIEIFDRFQNGSPLRVGERLHSLSYTPLIQFTIDTLRTPGVGLTDLFTSIWGPIKSGSNDKRFNDLAAYVAVVNGAAHGFDDASGGITKKYESLRTNLTKQINRNETLAVLNELASIYQEADTIRHVAGRANLTVQRNTGNFNGCIIYSLKKCRNDWPIIRAGWVKFIVEYRNNNALLDTKLHSGLSKARSWNIRRWKNACHNIFPTVVVFQSTENTFDDSDSSDDDE